MTKAIATSFITMFVVMDPLGNIPVFLALSSGSTPRGRARYAAQAVLVALVLIFGFAVAGRAILSYLHVSLEALTVAGGLLLALIALEMLRGHYDSPDASERGNVALVPLGTPLIAGPGAIATTMVLLDRDPSADGRAGTTIGIALALLTVWLVLRLSAPIGSRVSKSIIHLVTRVMGLLLAGIAVEMIFSGSRDWIHAFS